MRRDKVIVKLIFKPDSRISKKFGRPGAGRFRRELEILTWIVLQRLAEEE